MNQTQLQELLCKQLELLAERSKECADEELAEITSAMVEIYRILNSKPLSEAKKAYVECKISVDSEELRRILENALLVNLFFAKQVAESILSSNKEDLTIRQIFREELKEFYKNLVEYNESMRKTGSTK